VAPGSVVSSLRRIHPVAREQSRGEAPIVLRVGTGITLERVLGHQMRAMRDAGWDVRAVVDAGRWADDLEASRVPVYRLGMGRRPGPIQALRWAFAFTKLAREVRPAVIHTHNAFHGVAGGLAALAVPGASVVHTVHNWWFLGSGKVTSRAMYWMLECVSAACSDAVCFICSDDFADAKRLRIVRSKKRVFVGNGIDVSGVRAASKQASIRECRERVGVAPDAFMVLMAARIELPKDHHTVIAATKLLVADLPKLRVVMVGFGDQHQPVIDAIAAEGLGDTISVFGHRHDAYCMMRAADLCVLSSIREGFGRVLAGSMPVGTPVIGSDVAGIRDVIRHDHNGLLVPPRDAEALASAIRRIRENPELANRLAAVGTLDADNRLDERHAIGRIDATYQRLIGRSGSKADVDT